MAKLIPKAKVKPRGVIILLYGLAILIAVNLLNRFNLVDLTGFQPNLLTLLAILFVGTEIGIMSAIRNRKKLDGIQWLGIVVVSLAFISLVSGSFGFPIQFLSPFQGFVDLALLIYVAIEIFR